MNLWLYGVCNGKYLAVSYSSNYEVNQDNNIVESDNVKTGIIIVDLSSKKIINKVLTRATQAACYDISLHESKLYYVFNYTDDRYDKEKAATLSDQEYVPYVAEHIHFMLL